MDRGNPVRDKSYAFALAVVQEVRGLRSRSREYELTGQLLRSATSIGANVEEATAGQSKKDFTAKMAIASKEARESRYWIRLLTDAGILSRDRGNELCSQCEELVRLLTAIVKTSTKNG